MIQSILILMLSTQATPQASPPADVAAQAAQAIGVRACSLESLIIETVAPGEQIVVVSLGNEAHTLSLRPGSLRGPTFQLLVQGADGAVREQEPPMSRLVRGAVDGIPDSDVAGSLRDGRLTARVSLGSADGAWYVQSLLGLMSGAPAELHAIYRESDILLHDGACDESPPDQAPHGALPEPSTPLPPPGGAGPRGATTDVCQIAYDVDVEYFQASGSSIAGCFDNLETELVAANAIYRSQLGISYVLTRVVVRTAEPDPYSATTVPATALQEFRNEWEANWSSIDRDVAQLKTGRDLDGSVIGRSYGGGICNSSGYLISMRFDSVGFGAALVAHELGHNWSAPHCAELENGNCPGTFPPDCGIMCACIGGCNGSITTFGATTVGIIDAFRDTRNCLHTSADNVYVDVAYNGDESGTPIEPYNRFREGAWGVNPDGTVHVRGGTYDEDGVLRRLDRPMRLEVWPGNGVVLLDN